MLTQGPREESCEGGREPPKGSGSQIPCATLARSGEEGVDDLGESYGKWLRVQVLGLDCLPSCPVSATSPCDTHSPSASYESGPIYSAGNLLRKSTVSRAFYLQRAEMDNKTG